VALPSVLQKVVDWLRAGYPEGVPEMDYIPLFALLSRRLSSEEVSQVAAELAALGEINGLEAVRQAVSHVTHQPALDSDVARVESRLAAVGWVPDAVGSGDSITSED
jgi:hypothetical protein